MPPTFILPFDSPLATLANVGGKGANLSELTRAGFPVPAGFLISTDAYRALVNENNLQPRILQRVRDLPLDDPPALDGASEEIRAWFDTATFSNELRATIRDAYTQLQNPSDSPALAPQALLSVAVRSSATAEDLPGLSFAGQQDTFLNVIGDDALLDAVKKCWSSLWTARALGYRARNGIAPDEVALAVVVQLMIAAETSGVLFTANPLTGRRDQMVIDASLGLGEAIVSGQVEPDHYAVNALTWQIVEKTLGQKAMAIMPRADGGTQRVELADAAQQQALSDEKILELARLAQRVADHFGSPQDIEWALADDKLYLLQSRPITSLYPLPHHAPKNFSIYLAFAAIQGVLDPLTPLGMDALQRGIAGVFGLVGAAERAPEFLDEAGMRLFVNVTPPFSDPRLHRLLQGFLTNLGPQVRRAIVPLLADPRLKRRNVLTPRAILNLSPILRVVLPRALNAARHPAPARERAIKAVEQFVADVQSRADAAQTFEARLDVSEWALARIFPQAILNVIPAMLPGMIGLGLTRQLAGDDEQGTALQLTRGMPHNVTTAMDLNLWTRAQHIRADAASFRALTETAAPELAEKFRERALPPVAQQAVEEFLAQYGMRGVAEIDLGRLRWREEPSAIFNLLAGFLSLDDPKLAPDVLFARGAREAETGAQALIARVRQRRGRVKAWQLAHAIRLMRELAGLRETPKFASIRVFGMLRPLLQKNGEELAASGKLAEADDIFFLRFDELGARAILDLRALVAARRAEYEREKLRRRVPDALTSEGDALYGGAEDETSGDLVGEAVSPGVVEGIAQVMRDPRGARLAPGEILVCPATDPGWTPLFLTAGGLVMEIGGLVTHGSVVAREYGIPAVVGVHNATERIKSGDRVRVDGNRGRVAILKTDISTLA